MDTLRIQTFEARYHLPPSAADQRQRLDRLLPEALGGTLDLALEQVLEEQGIGPDEELCLREVRVPVRLGPGAGDDAVVLTWSGTLAEGIARAVRDGGPGVVRYRSRRQALVDLATGVARGDHRRGWAWRQLGFGEVGPSTPAPEAAAVAVRALATEDGGAALVPVLSALAARGNLPALVRHLDPGWWPELAAAALAAAGWPVEALNPVAGGSPAAAGAPAGTAAGVAVEDAVEDAVKAALARSPLATTLATLPRGLRSAPRTASALAALALLDAEPAPAADRAALAGRIAVAAALLAAPGDGLPGEAPVDGRRRGATDTDRLSEAATRVGTAPEGTPGADRDRGAAGDEGRAEVHADAATGLVADEPPSDLLAAPRQEGATAWGGLLFLVGLAEDLGLPAALAGDPVLRRRPFRATLHRLALELVPAAPDDPAALAFAGLPPGADPPAEGDGDWEEGEIAALRAHAAVLATGLAERLAGDGPALSPDAAVAEEEPAALVHRVCSRSARIVADPGWIDVHLSLADVSTELRRAGLDLDPGWVPWLGVVLRFRYE